MPKRDNKNVDPPTEDEGQPEEKKQRSDASSPAMKTQTWDLEFAHPEMWVLGKAIKWGGNGVMSLFVVDPSTAKGSSGPYNKVFHMPPGVVCMEPCLEGLGEPSDKPTSDDPRFDSQLTLRIRFGNLSESIMKNHPWLHELQQRYIDYIEKATPIVIRTMIKEGYDETGVQKAEAAAKEDFKRNYPLFPKEFSPLPMPILIKALMDDGEKDEATAKQLVMDSELPFPSPCTDDSKKDLRERILKLVHKETQKWYKAKMSDMLWDAYTKQMKHIGKIEGEPGNRTMTLWLDRRSTYEPKKSKEVKPRQQADDPALQDYYDVLQKRVKWPVKYFDANTKGPLRDPETNEPYNTLIEKNPMLKVLHAGDLVAATGNIRAYYDNNGHVGLKMQPLYNELVRFASAADIPDVQEMLTNTVDMGSDLPSFSFGANSADTDAFGFE